MSTTSADFKPFVAGKTCLVTGGAGGLGFAIAGAFLRAGANVVVCDINAARLADAEAQLQAAAAASSTEKGSVLAVTCDIADADAVADLFARVAAAGFPGVDVLVNNAGILDRFDPVGDLDPALWDRVVAVNLRAPFLLTRAAVGGMVERGGGCIINIASGAAKAGWVAGTAYTTSKHGLLGLTKSTAAFYGGAGVRCNALLMGPMPGTNIRDGLAGAAPHPEGVRKVMQVVAAGGEAGRPVDLGEAAAYCVALAAGPGSALINGACINVDHGWTSVVG